MKILLSCAGGMSTSLLVEKMKKEANAQGKEYEILAMPVEKIEQEMEKYDVVLLAPQVKYCFKHLQEYAASHTYVPIGLINMADYGMINGKSVLKYAEKVYEEGKK